MGGSEFSKFFRSKNNIVPEVNQTIARENYNNFSYEESTGILLSNMEKLSKLLKDNKIDLSIAIYPWPGTLKYDSADNKQVEIWKDFCICWWKFFVGFS